MPPTLKQILVLITTKIFQSLPSVDSVPFDLISVVCLSIKQQKVWPLDNLES